MQRGPSVRHPSSISSHLLHFLEVLDTIPPAWKPSPSSLSLSLFLFLLHWFLLEECEVPRFHSLTLCSSFLKQLFLSSSCLITSSWTPNQATPPSLKVVHDLSPKGELCILEIANRCPLSISNTIHLNCNSASPSSDQLPLLSSHSNNDSC